VILITGDVPICLPSGRGDGFQDWSAAVGRMVRQVTENTTHYVWYPGDRREWQRAGISAVGGAFVFGLLWLITRDLLLAVVLGTAVTAGITGVNFGRRDARALIGFDNLDNRAARRAAVGQGGRAAWRAVVQGCYGAGAAVLIVNLPATGAVANWLLPLLPAVVGMLARQAGMVYERLGVSASTTGPAAAKAD
jgi:hypothetical protein